MTPKLMTPLLPVLCPARTEGKKNTGANGRRQVGPAGMGWGARASARLAGKRWGNELGSSLRQAHWGGREARTWMKLFRNQDGRSEGTLPDPAS